MFQDTLMQATMIFFFKKRSYINDEYDESEAPKNWIELFVTEEIHISFNFVSFFSWTCTLISVKIKCGI